MSLAWRHFSLQTQKSKTVTCIGIAYQKWLVVKSWSVHLWHRARWSSITNREELEVCCYSDARFLTYLPLHSQSTRWHQRLATQHTGIIHQIASGDIVWTVSHDVIHEVSEVKVSSQTEFISLPSHIHTFPNPIYKQESVEQRDNWQLGNRFMSKI